MLSPTELEVQIARALRYYAFHRPHSGLHGATPAEAYHGLDGPHLAAVHPRRGRRGDKSLSLPVTLEHFEGDSRLPLLRKVA